MCVCAGECADSGVISSPISTPSLTSTCPLLLLLPRSSQSSAHSLRGKRGGTRPSCCCRVCVERAERSSSHSRRAAVDSNTEPWRENTNSHQPTCRLYLLVCLNKPYVLFNSPKGRGVVIEKLHCYKCLILVCLIIGTIKLVLRNEKLFF